MTGRVVVGVDGGGTATRAVAVSEFGEVLGRGLSGGSNPRSSGEDVTAVLVAAFRGALSGTDPATVSRTVVGLAGAGPAGRERAEAALELACRVVGLGGTVELVTDLVVAFAAGSTAPSGRVLIAGTGAVAAAVRGHEVVRRADGYGWLAGDDGSAVWQGRAALRAVLRALDGRGPRTALCDSVCDALLTGSDPAGPPGGAGDAAARPDLVAQALLGRIYDAPVAALGRLAPLVSAAADAGDGVATAITAEAVLRLRTTLRCVLADTAGPVVLAGSVLSAPGPVGAGVRAAVVADTGAAPSTAGDGAGGAAALALRGLVGGPLDPALHRRYTATEPDR